MKLMLTTILLLVAMTAAFAEDWPTYRHDVRRTGVTTEELPAFAEATAGKPRELNLQWVREFPAPEPAWPDQPRLRFDVAYEPIVADGMLFVASARSASVTAFDAATGEESWRFYANGPVRFAPDRRGRQGLLRLATTGASTASRPPTASARSGSSAARPAERWILGNQPSHLDVVRPRRAGRRRRQGLLRRGHLADDGRLRLRARRGDGQAPLVE